MKIEVTAGDIKNGIKKTCGACPISLALQRHFPNKEVAVDFWAGIRIYDTSGTNSQQFDIPDNAYYFMSCFDEDESVQPFIFELRPSDQ